MAELNPNSNPLLLWNKIKELKFKLRQFETLLGICPFNLEDIQGPPGPPGPPGESSEDLTVVSLEPPSGIAVDGQQWIQYEV